MQRATAGELALYPASHGCCRDLSQHAESLLDGGAVELPDSQEEGRDDRTDDDSDRSEVVTSETDFTNRFAFPAISVFGSAFGRFRQYSPEFCSPEVNQRSFSNHTAGHLLALYSHEVEVLPSVAGQAPGSIDLGSYPEAFSLEGQGSRFEIKKRHGAFNNTPYWIFRVPGDLISSHSRIFGTNTTLLMRALLEASGALLSESDLVIDRRYGSEVVARFPD